MNPCRATSAPHPPRSAPRRRRQAKSRGVRRSEAATELRMPVDAQLTEDDEARLAAMWDEPLDAEPVGGQPGDDVIANLFGSSSDHQPRTAPRAHKSDRRPREARRRCLDRAVWPRAVYRWVAVGVVLVAALAVITIARSPSAGPAQTNATKSTRTPSGHSAAPTLRGSRELGAPHRRHTRAARARRDRNRRRSRARRARAHERAARRARAMVTHARHRARVPSRPTAPPPGPTPTPQTSEPRRTPMPPAPSSACDEFPPC